MSFKVGDRVAVNDPALAQLRAIMEKYGHEAPPNNVGVIDRIRDGVAEIIFDDSGQCAPYPLDECTLIDGTGASA